MRSVFGRGAGGELLQPVRPSSESCGYLETNTSRWPTDVRLGCAEMAARPPSFLGRTRERQMLDRLLDEARRGQSGVLVFRGAAGIGKTALLRYAARQAAGFRVAEVVGVQAEMELAFAGIHQLCAPMLAGLEPLQRPQRDALSVALGLASGEVPDRFLVSLAVLSLLSAEAEERPVLCLIEDAQWLDAASRQVLGFVARRVLAESVAIIIAIREATAELDFAELPEVTLVGLDDEDGGALLSGAVHGRLDDRVRKRIVAETRGNPLALLELPRHMSAAELAGGYELPVARDLAGRLEAHYVQRVGELPEATQRLLLLAAADPLGDVTLLLARSTKPRDRRDRTDGGGECGAAGDRCPGSVPPSAGAVGRVPGGVCRGTTSRASSPGGGERSGI